MTVPVSAQKEHGIFSSLPIFYIFSVSWATYLGGPRQGGGRLGARYGGLRVTTFPEPVLFTLRAGAQGGLASHLPVPSVPSLRGCSKLCEYEVVLAAWGSGHIRGAPLHLVGRLEARSQEAAGECRVVALEGEHRPT